jgi:DNA-3-methyladenine glycosylase II
MRTGQAKRKETDNGDIENVLTSADPKLGVLIDVVRFRVGIQRPGPSKASPFEALLRAIIYQRMAAKAAATIYKRLRQTGPLTPLKVLNLPVTTLRAVGLSESKAAFARSLAEWFNANRATARRLPLMSDEEVVDALTGIKGIGRWTANVFLIFNLRRLDVVPGDDLGIRRGVQLIYGLKSLPGSASVETRAERWAPYRSIACMYLWNAVRLKLTAADLRKELNG